MSEETTPPTPLLVHATLLTLSLNLAIMAWFCVIPNKGHYGGLKPAPQSYGVFTEKVSPFEPARIESIRRSARLPRKLEPVVAQIILEETQSQAGSVN